MITNMDRPRISAGRAGVALFILSLASVLGAETVTLPVAASVTGVGGVPFVSDARAFNTSYTDVLVVTAVFRFNGATQSFQLAPREAKAFDDICVSLFGTPNSLGAVEFTSPAAQGTLVVSSQLRSPVTAGGFVGMFIPGLPPSEAAAVTVLTGLTNGDSRTNIGVYNPNANPVTATIRLFDGPVFLGSTSASLAGHGVTQINNIYSVVGFGNLVRTNGHATVESSDPGSPLFTFAAEADNQSGDLILVVGAKDVAAPPGFNPPTATVPAATATPTVPGPSPTPTRTATPGTTIVNLTATQFQWTFSGADGASGSTFNAKVGQTYQLQIRDGDPSGTLPHGFGGIPSLGISGFSPLTPGSTTPRIATFTPTSAELGQHFFSCDQSSCGSGHNLMLGTIRVVNP